MRLSGKVLAAACVVAACGMLACGVAFAAAAKGIMLSGTGIWVQNKRAATVTALLTPAGAGQYEVVYEVTWEGKKQIWTGQMKGDLQNGAVNGTGLMTSTKRSFTFQATAVNGVISGKAYEILAGKSKYQGDIEFKPADKPAAAK